MRNSFLKKTILIAFLIQMASPILFAQNPFIIIRTHDTERFNAIINQSVLPKSNNGIIDYQGANVAYKYTITDTTFYAKVKILAGRIENISVGFGFDFNKWSVDNYVLMPAAAYNGNRFQSRRIPYSPKLYDTRDIGPDKPIIISDVPRLNIANGPSVIRDRSGAMASPAIGFYAPEQQNLFWLFTQQGNQYGDYMYEIEESASRNHARIIIVSPVARPLYQYKITDNMAPSVDKPISLNQGDSVVISGWIINKPANNLQQLYDTYFDFRKKPFKGSPHPKVLPYSAAFDVQEKKFNRDNFVPEHGYYAVGMRENFLQDWQIGWTGGMISTYPLLFAGSQQTQNNVIRNFKWLFPNGISPSGLFWDSGEKGTLWYGGDIRKFHTKNWHLIRKSGDGLYFVMLQFDLMKKKKIKIEQEWLDGSKKVADALTSIWKENKQMGQFVDNTTGKIIVGGSTSGAIVPAALALSAKQLNNPAYLVVAKEILDYFDKNYLSNGLLCGGPGDALQNFDSESAYALIESCIEVYRATNDKKYLDMAERATKQFATWVMAYDYTFPPDALFAKANIKSTGAVFANTQNKHGAPAICTFSGFGLLQLYSITQNKAYLELLHDIANNAFQYLNHPQKPIGDLPEAWISERVNTTDWNEGIGEVVRHTTWAETALMLTAIQIPGVYVNKANNCLMAFDHVQVQWVGKAGKQIKITNPTNIDAQVRILVDAGTGKAPEHNCLLNAPVVKIPAKKSITFKP